MKLESPDCGENLPAPDPAAPTLLGGFPKTMSSAPTVLGAPSPEAFQPVRYAVDHEAMTIPQYMARQQIEGVIYHAGLNFG